MIDSSCHFQIFYLLNAVSNIVKSFAAVNTMATRENIAMRLRILPHFEKGISGLL